jgi:hypothetical protein
VEPGARTPAFPRRIPWLRLRTIFAAVSLWLNAEVAAPDVAERAGRSVDVLPKVYAKCIDGQRELANRRIEAALGSNSSLAS